MTYFYKFVILIIIVFLSSCEIINPEEEIPSYIHLDKIDLITDYPTQGSNSHKISDAWVYLDNNLIGVFELPVTLPALAEGKHNLSIKAGIIINGIASSRTAYPFYTVYEQEIELIRQNTFNIDPTVSYLPAATFTVLEDFESAGITWEETSASDTLLNKVYGTDVFEGTSSGAAYLDESRSLFECVSSEKYSLPKGGAPLYLELNYKGSNTLTVGIFSYTLSQIIQKPVLYLNPTSEWKKIYLDLSTAVSSEVNALEYQVFIGALKDEGLVASEIYIDNIKLVH